MENNGHSFNGQYSNSSFDSEDILENAVSLSSAVVSEDDVQSISSDLLMIAPSPNNSFSIDPRLTVPPLLTGREKNSPHAYFPSNDGYDEQDSLMSTLVTRMEAKLTYFGYTRKQWAVLLVFGFANILATTVISIQAPFYPQEAEKKGATATEYGFVFGVFQLTMFIMSPVFGSLIGKAVPPKMMFCVGIFTTGTCALLFGFLDYIQDRTLFIVFSFLVRIVQACGDSAYVTASFSIIALEFPKSVATTFAALETCSGIGLIIGPTIGGALYELGGFILPFLSMGTLLFLMAVLTYLFLPAVEVASLGLEKKGGTLWTLIRIPSVAMSTFAIAVSSSGIGFLSATLEPHVRTNFNLTPVFTGLIFIIEGGMYALSAPLWGRLCDNIGQPKLITLVGSILCFVGFTFIGPAPFMPFQTILWVTCVGLAVFGLGVGASLVSGFIQCLQDALSHGFPDDISTYGLVSGLWTSSFALGCFAGPSIGGVLLDNFGFPYGSIYVLATQAIVASLVLVFLCVSRPRNPDGSDRDPLRFNDNISFGSSNKEKSRRTSYGTIS